MIAVACHRNPVSPFKNVWATSRTTLANGSFRSSKLVDFWYCRISCNAFVPGLYLFLRASGVGSPGLLAGPEREIVLAAPPLLGARLLDT